MRLGCSRRTQSGGKRSDAVLGTLIGTLSMSTFRKVPTTRPASADDA
jgi:hypothetical protein